MFCLHGQGRFYKQACEIARSPLHSRQRCSCPCPVKTNNILTNLSMSGNFRELLLHVKVSTRNGDVHLTSDTTTHLAARYCSPHFVKNSDRPSLARQKPVLLAPAKNQSNFSLSGHKLACVFVDRQPHLQGRVITWSSASPSETPALSQAGSHGHHKTLCLRDDFGKSILRPSHSSLQLFPSQRIFS